MRYGAKAYLFRSMPFLGSLIEQEKNFYFVCGCSWKYKESMMIFFFHLQKAFWFCPESFYTLDGATRFIRTRKHAHTARIGILLPSSFNPFKRCRTWQKENNRPLSFSEPYYDPLPGCFGTFVTTLLMVESWSSFSSFSFLY